MTKEQLRMPLPPRYEDHFKAKKLVYRSCFKAARGRDPFALTDEDYTPIRFFQETWGEIVAIAPITPGYLDRVDRELYFAILNYMRGANQGRPGRKPFTLEDLKILSRDNLLNILLPHLPVPFEE